MPKHEVVHAPGQPLSEELRDLLGRYFKDADLRKLERLGGKVAVSLTAPYTNRKRDRKATVIDEQFVQRLESARTSSASLHDMLKELTVKDLRQVSKMVGLPLRSSDTGEHIRLELIRYLQAEDVWRRISDTNPSERVTET